MIPVAINLWNSGNTHPRSPAEREVSMKPSMARWRSPLASASKKRWGRRLIRWAPLSED